MNIYDKMREGVAEELQKHTSKLLKMGWRIGALAFEPNEYDWESTPDYIKMGNLERAVQILSIRLNDKGEPDPEGRYGIAVVDRKAELPYSNLREIPHGIQKAFKNWEDAEPRLREFAEDMLKVGFVKEIKEE